MHGLEPLRCAAADALPIPQPHYLAAPNISLVTLNAHAPNATHNMKAAQAKLQQTAASHISLSIGSAPPNFVMGTAAAAAEIGHDQVLIVFCIVIGTPNQYALLAVPATAPVIFAHATCASLIFINSLSPGIVSLMP